MNFLQQALRKIPQIGSTLCKQTLENNPNLLNLNKLLSGLTIQGLYLDVCCICLILQMFCHFVEMVLVMTATLMQPYMRD